MRVIARAGARLAFAGALLLTVQVAWAGAGEPAPPSTPSRAEVRAQPNGSDQDAVPRPVCGGCFGVPSGPRPGPSPTSPWI
ncbi:MAG TPA: hypothetical protein VF755_10770 [Catenuloplanes sp.]|jgi:hypothetical protein